MALKEKERIILTAYTERLRIFTGRGDMHDFYTVEGAADTLLLLILSNAGNVVPLTAGSISMIRTSDGNVVINDKAMTNPTAAGTIDYTFLAAELTPGTFIAEITITTGGNTKTLPEKVRVYVAPKVIQA